MYTVSRRYRCVTIYLLHDVELLVYQNDVMTLAVVGDTIHHHMT